MRKSCLKPEGKVSDVSLLLSMFKVVRFWAPRMSGIDVNRLLVMKTCSKDLECKNKSGPNEVSLLFDKYKNLSLGAPISACSSMSVTSLCSKFRFVRLGSGSESIGTCCIRLP